MALPYPALRLRVLRVRVRRWGHAEPGGSGGPAVTALSAAAGLRQRGPAAVGVAGKSEHLRRSLCYRMSLSEYNLALVGPLSLLVSFSLVRVRVLAVIETLNS